MTTAWAATTAHTAEDLVRPTNITGTGLLFRCATAGTTGSTEPVWPSSQGYSVVDGTVLWVAVALVAGACQDMRPGKVIELFQLELNSTQHGIDQTYYFHAGADQDAYGEVLWQGQNYLRLPLEADGFEYNGQAALPRPRLRVSNIQGTITTILQALPGGMEGVKVTRIRTLARYLDGDNFPGGINPYGTPDDAEFPREIYYVDRKTRENRDVVEFELAAAVDLAGVRLPKRQCIANLCQWIYRSSECGYTGTDYFDTGDEPVGSLADDKCGKRLSSCQVRFGTTAVLPFGSFPGVGSNFG